MDMREKLSNALSCFAAVVLLAACWGAFVAFTTAIFRLVMGW